MLISCDWGTSSFRLRLLDSPSNSPADGSSTAYGPGPQDNPNPADKPKPGNSSVPADNPSPATAKVIATLSTSAGIAATHTGWQHSGLPETERVAFYRAVLEKTIDQLADSGQASGEPRGRIDLQNIPVIISGMASSSIGMLELPYKPLPFDVSGIDLMPTVLPTTKESPRVIYLLPGVRSADDVMRGEETQLIGCGINTRVPTINMPGRNIDTPGRTINTRGERVFVFPGTHSKHIYVRDGQATAFKTYMTGELFALLTKHSVLAASMTAPGATGSGATGSGETVSAGESVAVLPEAFFAGIAASRDTSLLHTAFLTRTNQLFDKYSKEDNYHFLSGLLIGEELRDLADTQEPEPATPSPLARPTTLVAVPPSPGPKSLAPIAAFSPGPGQITPLTATFPGTRHVTLVASSPLRESYAAALAFLGFWQLAAIDADDALIAGHCAIFARFGATIAPLKNS